MFRPILLILLWLPMLPGCVRGQQDSASKNSPANRGGTQIQLSRADAEKIGKKIWQNECSGTVEGLTSWNAGEDFASLGIGHFIWYVPGRPGPFDESFPKLIAYLKAHGTKMPEWLAAARGCPWKDRKAFMAERNSARMRELRQFLANTVPAQTDFIVRRLEQALPKMLAATPDQSKPRLTANFYRVAGSRNGVYALIDYVNFKGEGVKKGERYAGMGWGLRDVLLEMADTTESEPAVREFSEAAKRILRRRVENAPKDRNESRWLAGWMNRCEGYKKGP